MQTTRYRTAWCGLLSVALCWAAGGSAAEWSFRQEPGKSLTLKRAETTVWQFHYGADVPKPFFDPVALPDGRNLTWNRPPDHPWHHGLWFAWKFLDKVNYWEPEGNADQPPGRTEWSDVDVSAHEDGSARIAMKLTYRPAGERPVLTENRVVEIAAPDRTGQYHFDWTSTFTAGAKDVELSRTPLEGEPGGVGWGGYAGLSLRLARALTDRAADTTEGPVEFDQQSRYRGKAPAMDYHGLIDGKPVGVAVCDHPDNLNHPSPWYAIRDEPMSYFSPAVLCYGPYTLKAAKSLTLRYRIIVHPGRWDAKRLRQQYDRFVGAATEAVGSRQ
ncbi:MAG: PmoA family protein [Pirellulales bacterium]|nr:PmoA family protein [Pirellulales bacterium]